MRSLTAMDVLLRNMTVGLVVFLLIGTAISVASGDSLATIVVEALVAVGVFGFLAGCRLYALRR